jgi:hypothetical protein
MYAAFRTAATAGEKRSDLLLAAMGLSRGAGELTALEIATEAVMLRHLALDAAGVMGARYLVARFEYPIDAPSRSRERWSTVKCAQGCIAQAPCLGDLWLIYDLVRDFVDKPRSGGSETKGEKNGRRRVMIHTDEWWARHSRIAIRSIYYHKSAVNRHMESLEVQALDRVAIKLNERGITWQIEA